MAKNDGEVICIRCKTKLNRTDLNCWRCGSTELDNRVYLSGDGFTSYPREDCGLHPEAGKDPNVHYDGGHHDVPLSDASGFRIVPADTSISDSWNRIMELMNESVNAGDLKSATKLTMLVILQRIFHLKLEKRQKGVRTPEQDALLRGDLKGMIGKTVSIDIEGKTPLKDLIDQVLETAPQMPALFEPGDEPFRRYLKPVTGRLSSKDLNIPPLFEPGDEWLGLERSKDPEIRANRGVKK